jgi:uncharacterized cupredoxin-like copper-binding protein
MLLRRVVFGGVLALLLAACAGAAPELPAINVTSSGMQYQPSSLEVTAGQPLRLTLTNSDPLEHDFSIATFPIEGTVQTVGHGGHAMGDEAEQLDLHVGAAANGSGTIEFTPSQPGTYEFFCTVAGHKEAGMVGSLVVNAP